MSPPPPASVPSVVAMIPMKKMRTKSMINTSFSLKLISKDMNNFHLGYFDGL